MPETESRAIAQPGERVERRASCASRLLVRIATAGIIIVGALGVADPSWAGPLMGC